MNAMEHGNRYESDKPVSIRVLQTVDAVLVRIVDCGEVRGVDEPEAPDLEAKLEGRQSPRGWGLFLIKELVDDARVTTEDGRRTLELVLRLEGGDDGDA